MAGARVRASLAPRGAPCLHRGISRASIEPANCSDKPGVSGAIRGDVLVAGAARRGRLGTPSAAEPCFAGAIRHRERAVVGRRQPSFGSGERASASGGSRRGERGGGGRSGSSEHGEQPGDGNREPRRRWRRGSGRVAECARSGGSSVEAAGGETAGASELGGADGHRWIVNACDAERAVLNVDRRRAAAERPRPR